MNVKTITRLSLVFCLIFGLTQAMTAQTFWSEDFSSQSDFESNWTNGGDNGGGGEVWTWSDDPGALTFGSQPDFGATTAANGFILFNSDGNGENVHDVTITSPVIDCSGQSTVFLSSENQYAYFSTGGTSVAEVGVSIDGGDFLYRQILADVEQNALTDAVQPVAIELPEAANQSNVRIQFRWRGNFEYAWKIDDINLSSMDPTPLNDLTLFQPRSAFNFETPVSMIDTVFMAFGIQNNGLADQFNVSASANISGSNGDTFDTTETTDTLQADSTVFFLFDESFIPSGEGNYTLTYTTSSDSTDSNEMDNEALAFFRITEDIFSKDDNIVANATQPLNIGDFWEIGNYYVVPNGGYEAYEAEFSVASNGNAHQGQQVTVFLYKVKEDSDPLVSLSDDDLDVVGFGEYTFTNEENFDIVTVGLDDLIEATPGVVLEEGAGYILTIQYTPDMFVPYSALPYWFDIATVSRGDGGDWFNGGFGPEITALCRMRIREEGAVSTQEPQLEESKLNLFPNPVKDQLTLELALEDINEQVEIQIIDATGKTMFRNIYENIQKETLNFVTAKYPAGNYFLHVRTAEGVKSERFVVQH